MPRFEKAIATETAKTIKHSAKNYREFGVRSRIGNSLTGIEFNLIISHIVCKLAYSLTARKSQKNRPQAARKLNPLKGVDLSRQQQALGFPKHPQFRFPRQQLLLEVLPVSQQVLQHRSPL